jgi:hypothetical protein
MADASPSWQPRNVDWGGVENELDHLVNPETISQLVVFDTWTLNCDRYPPDVTKRRANPDNVFLSSEKTS